MNRLEGLIGRIERQFPYTSPKIEPLISNSRKRKGFHTDAKRFLQKEESVLIEPMVLFKSLDSVKVSKILDDFTKKGEPKIIKETTHQNISVLINNIKENKLDNIDPHELLAVLFLALRQRWNDVDLEKEQKSIEAVCEILVGNHVNLAQGDGKSTRVIPICSTMRALLHREDSSNSSPALIVSASDGYTLTELQNELRTYKKLFFNLINEDQNWGAISKKLVDCQIPDTGSDSILNDKPPDVFKFASVNGIKILLLTHRQLIFEMENNKNDYGLFPPAVVDEVHLLDKSRYYRSSRIKEISELGHDKKDDVDHLFGRILVDSLEKERDYLKRFFIFSDRQPELSEEGAKFVRKLSRDFSRLIGGSDYLKQEIFENTGGKPRKLKKTALKVWDTLKKLGEGKDFLANSLTSYISVLTNVREGTEYSGEHQPRDPDRGISLSDHEFNNETKYWLSIINKKVLQSRPEAVSHYFNFSSWLSSVAKGRIIGLSGGLVEQGLKGQLRMSHLAETLKEYTKGDVIDLSKDRSPLPIPFIKISDTDDDLIARVVEEAKVGLQAETIQPHFIICWNDEMAKKLSVSFSNQNIDVLLIDKDTIQPIINNTFRSLAERKVKIVITSGQGSFSQNIVDSLERFPDLKISVINPETEYRVEQGFHRKRADKFPYDFNIYFGQKNLLLLASFLPERKQKRLLKLLEKKEKIGKENIQTSWAADFISYEQGIEEEIRSLVVDALVASQNQFNQDEKTQTNQDRLFVNNIAPMIRRTKRKICNKEVLKNTELKEKIKKNIKNKFPKLEDQLTNSLVLEIQYGLLDFLSNVELSLYNEYLQDYNSIGLKYRFDDKSRESYLKYLWSKKVNDHGNSWKADFKNRDFVKKNIDAYINEELNSMKVIIERIGEYLSTAEGSKIDKKKIFAFRLVDLPFYPVNMDIEPKRFLLLELFHTEMPFGQTMHITPDLEATTETDLLSGKKTYMTLPDLLKQADEKYFPVGEEEIRKYYDRLQRLNPNIPLKFGAGDTDKSKENSKIKALMLPYGSSDTKAIVLIVEN